MNMVTGRDEVDPQTVKALVASLRPDDRREIEAHDTDVEVSIWDDISKSTEIWEGWVDGDLVAMWGVVPSSTGDTCGMWMFSTEHAERAKRILWTHSVAFLTHILTKYEKVYAETDVRYTRAIKWLARLGFKTVLTTTHGEKNVPFAVMVKARS